MIIPIHASNPGALTGGGNWTYLLTGARPVLIDAGVGETAHLDALAAHAPRGPADVIVTHAHPDHASGAPAIAKRWPHVQFWKLPWSDRDALYPVRWNALADHQVLEAGDDSLEVVHTPGHAPDHICLWQRSSSTLFSGDLVVLGSTVVIPASLRGNLVDYLDSLARVSALAPAHLLPAHGPVIEEPQAIIREYVDHRRERERQVLAAVEAGCTTVEQIAETIYFGLSTTLASLARESVLAHLLKLEQDGTIRRVDNTWHAAGADT